MNNIGKAQKNLKKKLSLDDYMLQEQEERHCAAAVCSATDMSEGVGKEDRQEQLAGASKIKATYYLTEDDHSSLTHVYIKRLQDKKKTDRSALIGEAIRLLYEKEMA